MQWQPNLGPVAGRCKLPRRVGLDREISGEREEGRAGGEGKVGERKTKTRV